ncbi:MAG: beta-propeller fold lactonase family protein, partial [Gammaproteobacteria bacterium]|nr:beta-propeller fold lactonase family protein [Gammaproteobacteria bacterium]
MNKSIFRIVVSLALLCLQATMLQAAELQAAESLQAPQFAYGANNGDWSLTAYRVNPATGTLSHHGNWPAGASAAAVAVHPAGFVISVSMTEDWLNVHRISDDGRLTKILQSPFKAGVRAPFSISLHPAGRLVYVSARGGQVAGFALDPVSGVMTPVPGSPFDAQRRTRSVMVHPSGRFVYASNAYDNSISAWRVNEKTGELSSLNGSPFATGEPGNLHPDLMSIIDAPPEAGGIPYMVAIHPSGRYLYVTNWMGPSLSMFAVDADNGELTPLPGSPMLMGNRPYVVTVHPSGNFVYVTSWDAQAVYGYAVDANSGALRELTDSPYYTGAENPIALRINAAGSLAYVVNSASNTVSVFSVDADSGSLVLQQTMRSRYEPFDIALAEGKPAVPMPRFAYSIDEQMLRQFRVDSTSGNNSGELNPVAELKTGFAVRAVAVDPRGRFVYLAGEFDGQGRLGIYRINPEG